MASFAESFGASVYYNSSAAMAELPEAAPIQGLSHLNSVPYSLPGGLVAQRWVSSGASGAGSTLALRWHEGDWTIWVFGGISLRNTATSITTDLQHYRLPPFPGVLSVDAAPDGQHSNLAWTTGDVVYQVGAMHQVVHAIEMAASMRYYAQG
ncbi:MAG: hypothetical protein C7B46_11670 [Sulfobacillus benefaciens]|uniref:Uncharacterized protein n=1 Tax=Sulfobacillus benefaciens TaxID=453960 RepID=A0A2T2XEW5_9FIRM|nr:MAG: hypothetical protein C7B46_11670 [Sulfobacillus benefaciens]